jgi:hypothetical protein
VTWDGAAARAGLAATLTAAVEGTNVNVFSAPPSTFNPPALVVQYPTSVTKYTASYGLDMATWAVMAAVGLENQSDYLDQLCNIAADAVYADPSISGVTQSSRVTEFRNWRILLMSGVELLTAEVIIETRM